MVASVIRLLSCPVGMRIALFSATYFAMAMTLSTRCPVSAEMNTDGAYDMKVSSLAISFLKSFIV